MERNYMVSFGDSNTYISPSAADAETLRAHLVSHLQRHFPQGPVDSIVTVDIREASPEEAGTYPLLDEDAIAAICAILKREMQVNAAERELNRNAPFAETETETETD